jgi:hypothetical protein
MIEKLSFLCLIFGLLIQGAAWVYLLLFSSDGYSTIHEASIINISEIYSFLIYTIGIAFSFYVLSKKLESGSVVKSAIIWLVVVLELLLMPQDLRIRPGNGLIAGSFLVFMLQVVILLAESRTISNER